MSSVTTTALLPPLSSSSNNNSITPRLPAATPTQVEQTCHKCGADLSHSHLGIAEDARVRIEELEAQVRILTGKATAAVDKLADYEDELRQLKSAKAPSLDLPSAPNRPTSASSTAPTTTTTTKSPLPSRLSNLLPSTRRTTSQPDLHHPHPPTNPPSTNQPNPPPQQPQPPDLHALLTHERTLRLAAESRAEQTNAEIEELSAQLFSEANEMVAAERKARRRLEERVEVLERRDGEKRGRLEVLEWRLGRIERVRGLLGEVGGAGG
ncbi:hypothetical protein ACLMJK_009737 [Lecanora helva]